MITLPFEESSKPLYLQIYIHIKNEIRSGKLKSQDKLPSKRKLAAHLGVSVNTIDTAYSQLISEGFIQSAPKRGYFVCDIESLTHTHLIPSQSTSPSMSSECISIDFSTQGIAAENFPFHTWLKLMKNTFHEGNPQILNCAPPQGTYALREAIATYVYQARGVNCKPEQVIVGAGTDNLLQMLSYILQNECIIAMENPVYHKAFYFFKRMGHQVLPIPVDNQGLPVEPLQNLDHVAIYVTPSHQFPLGISMPISRRIKLLNWANEGNSRYIIEDDYDSEFRYYSKPIPSLQSIDKNGKVIYLGTFSKSISPALRISYMILPSSLLEVYTQHYASFSSAVSHFDQATLNEFIRLGYFENHVNRMRKIYKKKREHLIKCLKIFDTYLEIIGEEAGHHLLVHLKTGLSETEMCQRAKALGVRVYPISPYFIGDIPPSFQSRVLLGYGTLLESEISEGVHLLKKAWLD